MLILTRRIGETLLIGTDVYITVLSHSGNQVRIGIRAPRTVEVHRQEVFNRIQQERAGTKMTDPAEATVRGCTLDAEAGARTEGAR